MLPATSCGCRRPGLCRADQLASHRLAGIGPLERRGAAAARDLSGPFGTRAYAREELVAELSTAYVCAALGIMPTVRHADYIGSWLDVLREGHRAIVRAASAASKAADFLLSLGEQAAPAQEHGAGPTTLRRPHQAVDATA
jgi:antirestriction protein ArdC